ncbi:unnamed protein product [Caenorhabditis brenneri]
MLLPMTPHCHTVHTHPHTNGHPPHNTIIYTPALYVSLYVHYAFIAYSDTEVSMEDFESDVEHGLKLLFRKASTDVKSESMSFSKFLNLFGFLILNVGFSDHAPIVVKINEGIEENEKSADVKLISMENVDFTITSLLLTAQ